MWFFWFIVVYVVGMAFGYWLMTQSWYWAWCLKWTDRVLNEADVIWRRLIHHPTLANAEGKTWPQYQNEVLGQDMEQELSEPFDEAYDGGHHRAYAKLMGERYIIICVNTDPDYGPVDRKYLSTRTVFKTYEAAKKRADSYDPSHQPEVITCLKGCDFRENE